LLHPGALRATGACLPAPGAGNPASTTEGGLSFAGNTPASVATGGVSTADTCGLSAGQVSPPPTPVASLPTTPTPPPRVPTARTVSPVYHPPLLHRDPRHIHPMVTGQAAGTLRSRALAAMPGDSQVSPVPSSVRAALLDPH